MAGKFPSAPRRPPAGNGSSIGQERYNLLRSAFRHAQKATKNGQYLEAIAVLESILADRLGSLVHGSLGQRVTLRHTLGGLIELARKNTVFPKSVDEPVGKSQRNPLPDDVVRFVESDLAEWWQLRNEAVHGMATVRQAGDSPFRKRYSGLEAAALKGFAVLTQLDAYDQREREANGAGRSATWPDALAMDPALQRRLSKISTVTS